MIKMIKASLFFFSSENLNKAKIMIENCALLDCYTASSGDFLPTFRDNQLVPTSGSWDGQVVPKRQYEITTIRCVITQKSAVYSYFAEED
jgi:hypothetical protein